MVVNIKTVEADLYFSTVSSEIFVEHSNDFSFFSNSIVRTTGAEIGSNAFGPLISEGSDLKVGATHLMFVIVGRNRRNLV